MTDNGDRRYWLVGRMSRKQALDKIEDLFGSLDRPRREVTVTPAWAVFNDEEDKMEVVARGTPGAVPVMEVKI